MAAYIWGNVEITDPALYEQYRLQVPALIAAQGGRYLVRGGAVAALEGDYVPQRLVIIEFPDMARLWAFYDSPAYQSLVALRQRASHGDLFAVEGYAPS
ncbi:MAG: DUF1330 domain-containing protein [Pseudomonadota bacterium]|nr:DUF1330 domain-containing protein [Pseudomonadota bacterium]